MITPPRPQRVAGSSQRFLLLAAGASLFTPPVVLCLLLHWVGSHDTFLDRGSVPDHTKLRLRAALALAFIGVNSTLTAGRHALKAFVSYWERTLLSGSSHTRRESNLARSLGTEAGKAPEEARRLRSWVEKLRRRCGGLLALADGSWGESESQEPSRHCRQGSFPHNRGRGADLAADPR